LTELIASALGVAVAVIHGTDKLDSSIAFASAILLTTALAARPAHSALVVTAWLILLSFAATMAAPSPIAGVLRLVWSFIHRRPVRSFIAKFGNMATPGGLSPLSPNPAMVGWVTRLLALLSPASGLLSECGSSGFA
jgi:hypothetical protein